MAWATPNSRERATRSGADVDADDLDPHRCGELGRREPDRAEAEDGERVAGADAETPERAVGGPGAARDRRAADEGELVGQMHQRADRRLHEVGVPAVGDHAVHEGAVVAHLRPSGAAMIAVAAALVVEDEDAVTDLEALRIHAGADGGDDAAGLVAADDRRVLVDPARGENP